MSFSRRVRWGLLALLVAGGMVGQAAAQEANATISGTVVDEQGQVLPGATVTVVNENTKLVRSGVSDARGDFRFPTLVAGTYTVKVELQGFKASERRSNVLNASSTLSLGEVKLGLGALSEVVVVEDSGSKVNVEDTQHSGLISSTQIDQIQSKGRDVMNLLRALPGVRYMDDLDAAGDSFGSEIPHVGGLRQEWNRYTVDGLNGNELSGSRRAATAVNLDSIAEVKVLLNTYRAEFGGTGGSNIQIITKGGGSDYRGNLYWYGRRRAWTSNRWENNRTATAPADPQADCSTTWTTASGATACGLRRPEYHFDTFGFNFGGPVPGQKEKKLFFFYSLEAPNVKRPGPLRQYMLPTEAERRGDFSQSFPYGQPNNRVVVVDPNTGAAYSNNQIPANMIDRNMQNLMNMYPLPNALDVNETKGNYNFVRQETSRNPRQNHQLRFDWKPTEKDSLFFSAGVQKSYQAGSEITVGPTKWGFFDGFYDFGDYRASIGHTRIFSSSVINELSGGVRRQDEGFGADKPEEQEARLVRANVGFNQGQFYPELNKPSIIPRIQVDNINGTGVDRPDFSYDNRFGTTAHDYVFSVRDNLTMTKSAHTFKAGFMFERVHNNEAPGGEWSGRYVFGNANRTSNPLAAGSTYANMLMGVFNTYDEIDGYRSTMVRQNRAEWYAQDTWKASRRLTLDIGARFVWYTPYRQANGMTSAFVFDRYVQGGSPRMYVPAPNNQARDLVTGQTVPASLGGTFVPGTGNIANGMVAASDRSYPYGFRDNQGIHPEPRIGLAYDLFGNGKTGLHASAGLYHQGYVGGGVGGNLQGPPTTNLTSIPNGFVRSVLDSGKVYRPGDVRGLERDAKTPSSYAGSFGVRQEVGWGTVIDVSYVGNVQRHLEMQVNYNNIPAGAKFPGASPNPLNPTANLPDVFLRPYLGHNAININENWGTANYNALQVQLTRRYIKGLQFSIAYTWSKAMGLGGNDNAYSIDLEFLQQEYAPLAFNQTHTLVTNFTYDAPRLGGPAPVRFLLDNWQFSGEYVYASGDWAGISLSTTPSFDFTGGSVGARPVMTANPRASGGDGLTAPWFDITAFARPSGRGDFGNTPARVIQRPPINSLNLSAFKNFPLGKHRRVQFRLEGYNVLNHTQIRDIDRTARFDATGAQVNTNFGLATTGNNATRPPRVLQASVRLSF